MPQVQGTFFDIWNPFDSSQDVGHLRILEQGESQIPTLSRGGGGRGLH
jgi:hypothetical protein